MTHFTSFNPDSESVLDMLDRLEREATPTPWTLQRYPNRTLLTPDGKLITVGDKELLVLSRNHLRALIEVARAAETLALSIGVRSEILPGALRGEAEHVREALALLLTSPSEQKEETA